MYQLQTSRAEASGEEKTVTISKEYHLLVLVHFYL